MGLSLTRYGGSIAMSPEGASVLTVGSLIKYQLYWNMINNAYQSLNNVLNQFTRAAGAAERVLSLLDMEPDIDPGVEPASRGGVPGGGLGPGGGPGGGGGDGGGDGAAPSGLLVERAVRRWDLAFEGVRFAYQMRPQQQVLCGVSFTIDEGSVCALVGKSGGGKSTRIQP